MNEMNEVFIQDRRNFPLDLAKKFFLRLGIAILLQKVIWIALANVMATAVYMISPDIYNTWWFPWLYNDLPHYLIAIPICYLVLPKKIETDAYVVEVESETDTKPKFGIGKAAIALVVAFSALYIFAQVGSAVNNFLNFISNGFLGQDDTLNELISATPWYVTFIGTVILAPLMEEIVFRKWIIDRARPFGEFSACLLSGLLFGLFHGNFLQGFYATALGFIFAYVYIRTSNILYPIALHSIVNLFGSIIIPNIISDANVEKIDMIVNDGVMNGETMTALFMVLVAEILTVAAIIAGIVLFIIFVRKLVFKKTPLLDTGVKPTKLMLGNEGVIISIVVLSLSFFSSFVIKLIEKFLYILLH